MEDYFKFRVFIFTATVNGEILYFLSHSNSSYKAQFFQINNRNYYLGGFLENSGNFSYDDWDQLVETEEDPKNLKRIAEGTEKFAVFIEIGCESILVLGIEEFIPTQLFTLEI